MNEIIILQSAESDWFSIYRRYEGKYERPFVQAIEHLRSIPEMGKPIGISNYRRILLQKTPFGIFYSVLNSRVIVAAILDLRQDPERIEQHLKNLLP